MLPRPLAEKDLVRALRPGYFFRTAYDCARSKYNGEPLPLKAYALAWLRIPFLFGMDRVRKRVAALAGTATW
jgi:hypothetical protein